MTKIKRAVRDGAGMKVPSSRRSKRILAFLVMGPPTKYSQDKRHLCVTCKHESLLTQNARQLMTQTLHLPPNSSSSPFRDRQLLIRRPIRTPTSVNALHSAGKPSCNFKDSVLLFSHVLKICL